MLSHCSAKRATSREFFKSSLSLMCDRWVSTVFGLRCNSFAISRTSLPLPINSKISSSRSLSFSTASVSSFGLAMREFRDDLRRHGRAEVRAPVKNLVDCVDHIGHRFMFHDITFRSGAQRAQCVEGFIMHGKHQDGQIREFCSNVFDKLNPICPWQTQVDDGKVWIQFSDDLHPFGGSAGFTADRKIVIGTNQLLETFSKQRMIIDDDDSFRIGWSHFGFWLVELACFILSPPLS